MEMKFTANHAMARNMVQKATGLEAELERWAWTQEKDWESSLKCEQNVLFLHKKNNNLNKLYHELILN